MRQVTLSSFIREKPGKKTSKKLRKKGLIPAIIYGSHIDPIPIYVKFSELESILNKHKGETLLFNLKIENEKPSQIQAILKEYQIDPVTDKIIHIDFLAIHEKNLITIDVPLEFIGKPVGITKGGVLEILLHELSIECLPSNIPDKIQVDISNLDIGDVLHVKDIKVPEGVKVIEDPEETVVTIVIEAIEEVVEETEKSTE